MELGPPYVPVLDYFQIFATLNKFFIRAMIAEKFSNDNLIKYVCMNQNAYIDEYLEA